jgi:hypothetical protein
MSDKRYLGNIITPNPTAPAGPFQDDAASGVWSLGEAFTYTKAGLWPTAGNPRPPNALAANSTLIDSFVIATTGNTVDFGTASVSTYQAGRASSDTRALFFAGSSDINTIQFIAFASGGAASDFGDLTTNANSRPGCSSNNTRAIRGGGSSGGTGLNTIDFVTIASAGNATDFGDLTEGRDSIAGFSSTTRACFAGGDVPPFSSGSSQRNIIDFVTIASAGNAVDFGDLTATLNNAAACSSTTRGVVAAGFNSASAVANVIQYVTIASAGNAIDFGDLTVTMQFRAGGCSGETRGVFAGGQTGNVMNFITIATTGNASDFGDLTNVLGEGVTLVSGTGGAVAP